MRMCRAAPVVAFLSILTVAACTGGEDEGQRTETLSTEQAQQQRQQLPEQVVLALDSGNAAYRRNDYEAAREHFRGAVEVDSTVAAAWFGLYMVERALGNDEAAEAARERAAGLTGAEDMGHPEGSTSESESG